MGDYSRETFDKLKHYAGVRMQQGVPLIDADWNEMDEIRKEELRLFLEWYIGNGVPRGNDGFAILAPADTGNDFIIKGGLDGSPGCCMVKGMGVRIETDTHYTSQTLYENAGLAQQWGVTPLAPLTLPPSGARSDLVYLDVWEREVDSQEDAGLVNPAIGIETSVRIKREWVVRVAEGATALPAAPEGHAYYTLAVLTRRMEKPVIDQADIADKRRKNVEPMDNSFSDYISVQDQYVSFGKDVKTSGRFIDQTGYVMPAGAIVMWSGASNNIPQGWVLCNGNNNTPDLRDRFIVGAGNSYSPAATGGQNTVTLNSGQMPAHSHSVSENPHNHNDGIYDKLLKYNGKETVRGSDNDPTSDQEPNVRRWGSLQSVKTNISINNSGGNQAHENRPPYYALCFIMKL